ncbi:uncharacterized protein LOC116956275 [Petromyzon marinus]|uniref:uncharacterized protein LOC116956275 n=1 Tax=Petromyzon marinus TaxID=7757 RepID=UPI003F716066
MFATSSLYLTAVLCLDTGGAARASPLAGFNSWHGRRLPHPRLVSLPPPEIVGALSSQDLASSPLSGEFALIKTTLDLPGSPAIPGRKIPQPAAPQLLAAQRGGFLHDARLGQHKTQVASNKVDLYKRIFLAAAAAAGNANSADASEFHHESTSHQIRHSPADYKIEKQKTHSVDFATLTKQLFFKGGRFHRQQGHTLFGTSALTEDEGFSSTRPLEPSDYERPFQVSPSDFPDSKAAGLLAKGDSVNSALMPPLPPPPTGLLAKGDSVNSALMPPLPPPPTGLLAKGDSVSSALMLPLPPPPTGLLAKGDSVSSALMPPLPPTWTDENDDGSATSAPSQEDDEKTVVAMMAEDNRMRGAYDNKQKNVKEVEEDYEGLEKERHLEAKKDGPKTTDTPHTDTLFRDNAAKVIIVQQIDYTEMKDEVEGSSSGQLENTNLEDGEKEREHEKLSKTAIFKSETKLLNEKRKENALDQKRERAKQNKELVEASPRGGHVAARVDATVVVSRDGAARSWREFVARAEGEEKEGGARGGGILTLPVQAQDLRADECRAIPFQQRVWVSGCEPVLVDNAFCLGHCGSFHVPRVGGTALAASCACLPAGEVTRAVSLRCGSGARATVMRRAIGVVRGCACTA